MRPKVVLTYIDNNSIYHWLCKNFTTPKYIAIQNGIRQSLGNKRYKNFYHDQFFCYGMYDVKKHEDLGCSFNNVYPVGSMRVGLLDNNKYEKNILHDICLISSDGRRDPDIITDHNIRKIALENRKIDLLIKRYCEEQSIRLIIALSPGTDHEKEYFRSIFGSDIKFSENTDPLSTYRLLRNCNLAVSFMSTMLVEALSLDCKALAIHFNKEVKFFDYPKDIIHQFIDYDHFSKSMTKLLDMSPDAYNQEIEKTKTYVMNNNQELPPHIVIKDHINNIIS